MFRKYVNGSFSNVTYFTGVEVEKTPAYGMKTLFVVGLHPIDDIVKNLEMIPENIEHIFFGANHSFKPETEEEFTQWEETIIDFLERNFVCTLDLTLDYAEDITEGSLNEYNNFIPQVRIPIPYIKLWNYNTMIKIDDRKFEDTNPGVWCHSLHSLMDRSVFTNWNMYKEDNPVKGKV